VFHASKKRWGSCEHLWLGSQYPPCFVGSQHHIQNCHKIFVFSFNLRNGGALTHWARNNDFTHWNFLWMNPDTINCYNLMSWTNYNWKPTNPLKSCRFNKRKFLTKRQKKRNSKKVTLSWCLTFNIIIGLIRNCCQSDLDPLSSRKCL
jgi:hypothetical protein